MFQTVALVIFSDCLEKSAHDAKYQNEDRSIRLETIIMPAKESLWFDHFAKCFQI